MFIYQSDVCRNGNIKNCPKGFSPYTKEIVYGGGWRCAGCCRFDTVEQKELYESGDKATRELVDNRFREGLKLKIKNNNEISNNTNN